MKSSLLRFTFVITLVAVSAVAWALTAPLTVQPRPYPIHGLAKVMVTVGSGAYSGTPHHVVVNCTWLWQSYGPMVQYDGANVSLYRPQAAGGGSTQATYTNVTAPGRAHLILVVDTAGFADVYHDTTDSGNKLISHYDIKGTWTLAQFQSNISNYSKVCCDFGSAGVEIDDISILSGASTLFQSNFEGQSGSPIGYGWTHASNAIDSYGSIISGRDGTMVFASYGTWGHAMSGGPSSNNALTVGFTLDCNGGQARFGLCSSDVVNWTQVQRTASVAGAALPYNALVDLGPLPAGSYGVSVYLSDVNGATLTRTSDGATTWQSATWTQAGLPEWANSTAGVADVVLDPYTPVTASNRTVSVWGRQYSFNSGSPFPTQMISQGIAILAQPVTLRLNVGGSELAWTASSNTAATVSATGTQAQLQSSLVSGAWHVNATTTVEYDGMAMMDFTVSGPSGSTCNYMYLDVPIVPAVAQLNTTVNPNDVGAVPGNTPEWIRYCSCPEGWLPTGTSIATFTPHVSECILTTLLGDTQSPTSPTNETETANSVTWDGAPCSWIGSDEAGIAWYSESNQYWYPSSTASGVQNQYWNPSSAAIALSMTTGANSTVLRFHLQDGQKAWTGNRQFRIALHATPVRPYPSDFKQREYMGGLNWGVDKIEAYGGHTPAAQYTLSQPLPKETGTIQFWLAPKQDMGMYATFPMSGWLNYNIMKLKCTDGSYIGVGSFSTNSSQPYGIGVMTGDSSGNGTYAAISPSICGWLANQWHHVAITWSTTTRGGRIANYGVYIDGQLVSGNQAVEPFNDPTPASHPASGGTVIVGGLGCPYYMDGLKISNVVLSSFSMTTEPQSDSHTIFMSSFSTTPGAATQMFTENFEGKSGAATSYGWTHAYNTQDSWGTISLGRDGTSVLGGYGVWGHAMSGAPQANSIVTMEATLDANGGQPRFGLCSDSVANWYYQPNTWQAYGPMVQYDGANVTLYSPQAAGGLSTSVPYVNSSTPGRAHLIITIDTSIGIASCYHDVVSSSTQLISNFNMKSNWTLAQFKTNIQTYANVCCELGSQDSQVDNISVTCNPNLTSFGTGPFGSGSIDCQPRVPSILDEKVALGVRWMCFFENWSPYEGNAFSPYEPFLKDLISVCHAKGIKVIVYMGALSECPELTPYLFEMKARPSEPSHYYSPNPSYYYSGNSLGPYQDYLAYHTQRLITEVGIDGLYLDGNAGIGPSDNTVLGAGYVNDNGKQRFTYPIMASRSMMKRLRNIVTANGGVIFSHQNPFVCDVGFVDAFMSGETMNPGWPWTVPQDLYTLDANRVTDYGRCYGVPSLLIVHDVENTGNEAWFNQWSGLTLLHDSMVLTSMGTPDFTNLVDRNADMFLKQCAALRNFPVAGATWYPYWQADGLLGVGPSTVHASVYRQTSGAQCVILSNIGSSAVTANITWPTTGTLALATSAKLTDALLGQSVGMVTPGAQFSIPMAAGSFKILYLGGAPVVRGAEGTSIATARTSLDGTQVSISAKVVSANQADFPQALYVQEPDRSAGIRVLYPNAFQRGDVVNVTGKIRTSSDGEREIYDNVAVTLVSPGSVPSPLGLQNRSLGGSDSNVFAPGVSLPVGCGPYNKGVLVKSWGKVTAVNNSNGFVYIDDGTGLDDGSGNNGTKVSWTWFTSGKPVIEPPEVGWYVSVSGISSSEIDAYGHIIRVLRPRSQSDVLVISH